MLLSHITYGKVNYQLVNWNWTWRNYKYQDVAWTLCFPADGAHAFF